MVLLRGIDDLTTYKGIATEAFGAQALAQAQQKLVQTDPNAVAALTTFYAAAETLRSSENAFNSRARKGGPDLKANLRSEGQFQAIKGFNDAKQNLLGVDQVIGQQIVELVEKSIAGKGRKLTRSFQG